jgi:surface antigen
MRLNLFCAALAGVLVLASCETTSGGYGGGPPRTQLSQCMRNALIGAGVGAVAGAIIGDEDNRGENAAIGAAVGGLATYGACRWLSAREQQRVENAYYQSLNSGQGVNQSWPGDQGGTRSLSVARPAPAPDRGPECRRVSATVSDGQSTQSLPQETFCRNAAGQWVPA